MTAKTAKTARVLPFPERAEKMQRVLFIPDAHVPYHDKRAMRLLIKVATAEKFDTVVILGDFCDFYQVSFHAKSPDRVMRFKDELRQAAKLLRELEGCGFKRKIYIHGNHEYRLTRYLCDKAPELYELVVKQDLLGLASHGWEEVAYKDDIRIGRVYVTHDVGRAGIYSTRQSMHDYMDNVVIGHNHRMDYHVGGNAKGVAHVGASFGWLGDVSKVDYMHALKARSNWALGFGTAYIRGNGFAYLTPHPIISYTCVVNGRLYKG